MATVSCILACTILGWVFGCRRNMLVHIHASFPCFSNLTEHNSLLVNAESELFLDGNYISAIDAYEGYNIRTGKQMNV